MAKHTILIVDDDPLILNTLRKRFDTWDMEIFSATTPQDTKLLLEKVTPDLVLLDLLLTKDDGSTGILDFLESQPRLSNVPIIVLTNLDKPELKDMLIKRGVKEYIIKGSIGIEELYAKVLGYLEPAGENS